MLQKGAFWLWMLVQKFQAPRERHVMLRTTNPRCRSAHHARRGKPSRLSGRPNLLYGNGNLTESLLQNWFDPVVHPPLVTLSNHTNRTGQPYNDHVRMAVPGLPRRLPRNCSFVPAGAETHGTGVGNLMAFGFGFNKQKVLSVAEKFVQQGKLQNAISEYEKVLKADPKDLTVMNTIGDLYSRSGEHDKAAASFKNVGDAYAGQGFTVKAIAMYKKLSKLKPSTECVLRLAELYTQQGLFNDARAQYLQVAEDFLKSGQTEQAIRIFQKTLEMDPDNVP